MSAVIELALLNFVSITIIINLVQTPQGEVIV